MVAALTNRETIFTVLDDAARRRAQPSLALQLAACVAIASVVAFAKPQWWSVAALLLAGGLHGAWGLLVRRLAKRPEGAGTLRQAALVAAATGTVLATIGIIGLAVTLFTGDGRSPYDPCGPGATSRYCSAIRQPRQLRDLDALLSPAPESRPQPPRPAGPTKSK